MEEALFGAEFWTALKPYLADETLPTEWILNHASGVYELTQAPSNYPGTVNLGLLSQVLARARLRAHGDPLLQVHPALHEQLCSRPTSGRSCRPVFVYTPITGALDLCWWAVCRLVSASGANDRQGRSCAAPGGPSAASCWRCVMKRYTRVQVRPLLGLLALVPGALWSLAVSPVALGQPFISFPDADVEYVTRSPAGKTIATISTLMQKPTAGSVVPADSLVRHTLRVSDPSDPSAALFERSFELGGGESVAIHIPPLAPVTGDIAVEVVLRRDAPSRSAADHRVEVQLLQADPWTDATEVALPRYFMWSPGGYSTPGSVPRAPLSGATRALPLGITGGNASQAVRLTLVDQLKQAGAGCDFDGSELVAEPIPVLEVPNGSGPPLVRGAASRAWPAKWNGPVLVQDVLLQDLGAGPNLRVDVRLTLAFARELPAACLLGLVGSHEIQDIGTGATRAVIPVGP
jgi:hypothetical protein